MQQETSPMKENMTTTSVTGIPDVPHVLNVINRNTTTNTSTSTPREYVIPDYNYRHTIDTVDGSLAELQFKAHSIAVKAESHAKLLKVSLIISQILLITLGIAITVLSLNQCTFGSTSTKYVVGFLGALVTGIEGIRSTFQISKRASLFKIIHHKALDVMRKARLLRDSHLAVDIIEHKINRYYEHLGQLDISLFNMNIVRLPRDGGSPRQAAMSDDEP